MNTYTRGYIRGTALAAIAASGMLLLAGCGGGSSDSVQGSSQSPAAGATPVVPVVPPPVVEPPTAVTPTTPDFTDYLSKLVVSAESDDPVATDDVQFMFADDEDDSVFAPLLAM